METFYSQNLGNDAIDKMISSLSSSVETMLKLLTAGMEKADSKCNASFADMGVAIDAVVNDDDDGGDQIAVEISGDHQGRNSIETPYIFDRELLPPWGRIHRCRNCIIQYLRFCRKIYNSVDRFLK